MDVVELPIIAGPTAAGKSALALRLATRAPLTIVSADSRQLYRGFDLGTAKPSAAELARVPHAGIDLVDPTERFSAARWVAMAEAAIDEARARGRVPVVVGGTGLYLRALVEPLFEEPPLDPAARAALASELACWPVERLRARVETVDPERAHLGRTQLLRALEVAQLTGHPLSWWHRHTARPPRFTARWLVVDRGSGLQDAIEHRVDAMLDAGWLEEVRALAASVPPDAPAWKATGYAALREVVAGRQGLDIARREVIIRTRQYAKRQRTWFRHQLPATGVARIDLTAAGGVEAALDWWDRREERA